MNFRRTTIVFLAPVCIAIVGFALPALAQTAVLSGSINRDLNPNYYSGSTNDYVQHSGTQTARYGYVPPRSAPLRHRYSIQDDRTYLQKHPMVKGAAIGAGVGAVAGGLTGVIAGRGFVRGAAIGAGTGAGVGVVRTSQTMKRHPIIRDTATGTLAGLGVGWAAGGSHGVTAGKGAALGAAGGLGWGLLKNFR
jgi:hypothetical protein